MTQPPLPSRLWKHGFFFPEKLATWRSCHLIIKLAGTSLGRRHYTHGVDQSWVLGLQEWLNFQFPDFFELWQSKGSKPLLRTAIAFCRLLWRSDFWLWTHACWRDTVSIVFFLVMIRHRHDSAFFVISVGQWAFMIWKKNTTCVT